MFFLGLSIGLMLGVVSCCVVLAWLRALLSDATASERLRVREEGLDAASRITAASHQAQLAMLRVLMHGSEK